MFYYFIFYSFLGWIIDTTYSSLKSKKFINRSFLTGPLSPIYGFVALIIIPLINFLSSNLIIFFITSSLISTIVEYLSSLFFEKFYHIRWWNYSKKPFNLHGRICLEHSIYWGILSVFIIKTIHPTIHTISIYLSQKLNIIGIIIFILYLLIDIIHTFGSLNKFKKIISKPITDPKLNRKIRRLIKAFPLIKEISQKINH